MQYVDLNRRFRDLTQAELEEPELLAYWSSNPLGLDVADGWPALLECPRVILLAEAGSGKSFEMKEQARRLRADGKSAFFVDVETLDRNPLSNLLQAEEERSLEAWRADDKSTAWFFLDAVDELKLIGGKLQRALRRLGRDIDGLLHRAHIIISCRPTDWRPDPDMASVQEELPIPPSQSNSLQGDEDPFLAPLRRRGENRKSHEKKVWTKPRVVVLLPLSDQQVEVLASSLGVAGTAAFLSEIERRDAWIFARRPLDVIDLIASWNTTGQLGTLASQHSANIEAKLKDDPERPDRDVLSSAKAREGAQRLALALALTHTRTIKSPEQTPVLDRSEGVLDPEKVLQDWNKAEIQALLRRALFDPATFGRVRFHHRSVQEYLAACRLHVLRKKGLPARALRRLLFAELYNEKLVVPSMKPITAWLALWDDDTRRELMTREPETLLSSGDPESLSLAARAELLRAFAGQYGAGGWRGLNIPLDRIRRLACPEMGPVVRELWEAGQKSPDVREILLAIIWHGSITQCTDIARAVAFDEDQGHVQRVFAVRALATCGSRSIQNELVSSLLQEPERWPNRVIQAVIADIFPGLLCVEDLITLVRRAPKQKSSSNFSWALKQVVEAIDRSSDLAVTLRDALTELIWQGRDAELQWYDWKGRFDYVSLALAQLCERQLSEVAFSYDVRLVRACVMANRFSTRAASGEDSVKKIRRFFELPQSPREIAFWTELELMAEIAPTEDYRDLYFRSEHESVLWRLASDDRPWLLKALQISNAPLRRSVALHALLRLWSSTGRNEDHLNELISAVQDDAALIEALQDGSKVPKEDEVLENWERERRKREEEAEISEQRRLDKWSEWKQSLLDNPEKAFGSAEAEVNLSNLCSWLESESSISRRSVWDWDRIRQAFGGDAAARIVDAFSAFWRVHPPRLPSQLPSTDRENTRRREALTGLAAEAMAPGWAARLTPAEARIAAGYAAIETNAFPAWLPDLVSSHPRVVEEVIGGEVASELSRVGEMQHLRILQNLSHADIEMKRLLAPRLQPSLENWPPVTSNERYTQAHHQLEQVLEIVIETIHEKGRACLVNLCERKFLADSHSPMALSWLRALFQLDPVRAVEVFEGELASIPEGERSSCAVEALARLFGDRRTRLDLAGPLNGAEVLGRLIRCAFRYVRLDEDQEHEGAYTPNTRDLAERAREALLMTLLDTPGIDARRVALELVSEPVLARYPDRLRYFIRERAARDAENLPLRPEDILALERGVEAPPRDRNGLFDVMSGRLDDLAEELAHHDFSDRRTLQTIADEEEMQRTLALRLNKAANGVYVVSREDEVADRKRTDIRLAAVHGELKAVIEVKIADKRWTLTQLEHALRAQLVGQYLRHGTCKAGCLLLTHSGTRTSWTHPKTRRRLSFPEMIEYLKASAQSIEEEQRFEVRLLVFPLDLTDPSRQS